MCSVLGNAGSPHTIFRRALATGNVLIATSAAYEMPALSLADALALTLLYRDHDPARFERAVIRWHGRFCGEARGVSGHDALAVLVALQWLAGNHPEAAARSLGAVFDALVLTELSRVIAEWLERHSR